MLRRLKTRYWWNMPDRFSLFSWWCFCSGVFWPSRIKFLLNPWCPLEVGDFILVDKMAYGMKMPVLDLQLTEGEKPARGDVMVFIPPHDPRYFIKRVIGIPGDTVRYENKTLTINGERLKYTFVRDFSDFRYGIPAREYIEEIAGWSIEFIEPGVRAQSELGRWSR